MNQVLKILLLCNKENRILNRLEILLIIKIFIEYFNINSVIDKINIDYEKTDLYGEYGFFYK